MRAVPNVLYFTALLSVFSLTECRAEGASLITAWTKRISKLNLDNDESENIFSAAHHAVALDLYINQSQVFWSDLTLHKIFRASLDNVPGTKAVVVDNIETVDGLAVDWVHEVLYWSDTARNTIAAMNLLSSRSAVIVGEDLSEPRAIALHPLIRMMFWTDWGVNPKIERAGLDGSERKTLINYNLGWPNGLTLDFDENKLYWVDGKTERIEYCDYDGSGRKLVTTIVNQAFGISLFESSLYYSDWTSRTIRKISKHDGSTYTVLEYAQNYFGEKPMAVQVHHEDRQPRTVVKVDRCKLEEPCSHLCINNARNYTCFCGEGYKVSDDGKTCNVTGFLLTVWRDEIIKFDIKNFNNPQYIHSERSSMVGLDFLYSQGLIFWSNIDMGTISQGELMNMTKTKVLTADVKTVDGIAVDWVCNNLYWTDTGRDTIEVMSLETKARKVLYSDELNKPRAIVIYPPKAKMFFTDWGSEAKIESAALDGSERRTLITNGLHWPNGLVIDWDTDRLYWTDGKISTLSSCNFDGLDIRKTDISKGSSGFQVFGITMDKYNIFFSAWKSKSIYKIDKQNGDRPERVFTRVYDPMTLKIYDSSSQPQFENPCRQLRCSHICLPSMQGSGTCHCPSDLSISLDKRTCTNQSAVNNLNDVECRDFMFSAIDKTSVQISWKASETNFYIIKFECLRMVRCNKTCDSKASDHRYGFDTNVTVNHLTPGALYNVTLYVYHKVLHTDTFQTLDANDKVPGFVKDVQVYKNHSATVYWKAVEDCVPVLYNYNLFKKNDNSSVKRGILGETTVSFFNLEPGTEYVIQVKTRINGADSESSLNLNFVTSAVEREIQELAVYKHTRKEVGLRWAIMSNLMHEKLTYKVSYKSSNEESKYLDVSDTRCVSWPDMHCYTLHNLTAKRNYTISITPVFPSKLGATVNITATTKEAAPDMPAHLNVSSMTFTGLTLNWGSPRFINGHLRSFIINIEEVDKFLEELCCQDFPVMEIGVTSEQAYYETEIAGLQPASSYAVSVSAKTVYFGPPQTLTVHTKPPSMKVLRLPNVKVTWHSQDTAELNTEAFNPLIVGYMLVAVCLDTNQSDTGIADSKLNTEVVEALGPNVFLVAQYFENGETIDLTSRRDVECEWGEARTTAFLQGHKYILAAIQVAQYNDVYRVDTVLTDEFVPVP